MSSAIHQVVQDWVGTLPRGLASHIGRVETLAGEFAQAHRLEPERVRLCAQAHDLCRWMRGEDLLTKAKELGIPVHVVEEKNPILLHGQVAAELLRLKGLDDQVVYDGVYHHSTAYPGLHPVAKAVFLADKLEPNKAGRYAYSSEALKARAMRSLDEALLEFLSREIGASLARGQMVHPSALDARNELLAQGLKFTL